MRVSARQTKTGKTGLLGKIVSYLGKNRLGELMVLKGHISPKQLQQVLKLQKEKCAPLGQILVDYQFITQGELQRVLVRQRVLKVCATLLLCAMSFSSFGMKKARADYVSDVPAKIMISAKEDFAAVSQYPALFGADEKQSGNLKPFTKWTQMFDRFDRELKTASAQNEINKWQVKLRQYEGMPLEKMATRVNDFVNETRYIVDSKNWGKSDYWATPVEFIRNGGDCEDFAIAKYTALRMLGVPEERLRIAIVHDNLKNIPHAVLVVYSDNAAYILDNQKDGITNAASYNRYRPIFSINRQAWWLHTVPQATVLASAN